MALGRNLERAAPLWLFVTNFFDNSTQMSKNLTYRVPQSTASTWWRWCGYWKEPQHVMYQIANICFVAAFLTSNASKKGALVMHICLVCGLCAFCAWAWNVICAPDVFTWNFAFMLMNMAQIFHLLYQLRPVKFDSDLEEAYHTLFAPFKISRVTFKRMVSAEFAELMTLHAGEAYAVQNLTRTDRLALLLSGKVNVLADNNQFLHSILPCEFLDSPEFESSRNTADDKFNVSIVAASACTYLFWQRGALEYLFVKDVYVATVLTTLIARDITTKLYAMNTKIVTANGSHLDIRLPSSMTSTLTQLSNVNNDMSMSSSNNLKKIYKSPVHRAIIRNPAISGNVAAAAAAACQFKVNNNRRNDSSCQRTVNEMEPMLTVTATAAAEHQQLSNNNVSNDVENWLETSSKYHSCELVEEEEEEVEKKETESVQN